MKISLNWLKEFVDFNLIEKELYQNLIIGEIKEVKQHPDAETLKVLMVDTGEDNLRQIVCAGTNVVVGAKAPIVLPGTVMPNGMEIKKAKMRGVESDGMICGADELGFATQNHAKEIMIIETIAKPGTKFLDILGTGYSSKELKDLLTIHTAEIEGIENQAKFLDHVVTGKMIEGSKIEGSDKLHKGIFDIGWRKVQIVYGSVYPIQVGDIVPVALSGAILPKGEIKNTEFLGVKSEGMLCGDDELGIDQNTWEGITRFPANTPLGKPVAEILEMMQSIIEVDNKSLTHRPDLWSHYGFARELAAILGKTLKPFEPKVTFPTSGEAVNFQIETKEMVRGANFCIVKNVKTEESPQWIKSRLIACGIRPINNIVDIINYVMIEMGQPMHAYDRKITGDKLTVRKAKKNEILETIDHKNRKLTEEDIVMANDNGPLLILGIMGGVNSEISNETTEIIFESGCWDPILVRKASQRIGLRSESSQRYEKSLHPKTAEIGLKRACELLLQICPNAQIAGPVTQIQPWNPENINIEVDTKKLCSKIGVEISAEEMIKILTSLEFNSQFSALNSQLLVQVPYFRATKDVSMEDDIVEEVARIYGYENIAPILPNLPIKSPTENIERIRKHEARKILSLALGFNEVINYSFYSENDFKNALLEEKNHIKVENYLSLDQTHMRVSLIPNILKSVHINQKEQEIFKLFEIGRTYIEEDQFMPKEEKKIAALISNKNKNDKNEIFYEIKGAVTNFLKLFNVGDIQITKSTNIQPYAHPQKCAEILIDNQSIGHVYVLNPIVRKNFDLEGQIGIFELNLTKLVSLGKKLSKYKPLPKFPGTKIDVSVVIDKFKTVEEITNAINKTDSILIKEIELFDIYESKELGENKKALAFSIFLQAEDRTLTDQDIIKIQSSIFTNLEKTGGVIRGK